MAHYVGKLLHIRPSEILDTWGVPELLVAYGEYANEAANEAYQAWVARNTKNHKDERPPKYIVQFIGVDEIEALEEVDDG